MRAASISAVLTLAAASAGCRQLLGIDDPVAAIDASTEDAPADGAPDDVAIDAPPGSITKTFRQNVDGFTGVVDTYLDGGAPNQTRDTNTDLRWRPDQRYALIRFDGLFSGANAIPLNATILSATLTLNVSNPCATPGTISEVTVSWGANVTFNSFGPSGGVDATDVGASIGAAPYMSGATAIDVLASVDRWAHVQAVNNGWIIAGDPTQGAGDCAARSSEDGTIANRPLLTVTYQ